MCNKCQPIWSSSQGANGPIPLWGFITKTVQFQGKLFTSNFLLPTFCKQLLLVPFWTLISFKRFRITVAAETSQIMFACMAAAHPTAKPSMPSFCKCAAGPPALPGITPPPPTSQAKGSQVDLFQSNSPGNQSRVDPPVSFQPIPDTVHQMSNFCLKSFPLYSTWVMWCPILPMAWSTTSTWVDTPSFRESPLP